MARPRPAGGVGKVRIGVPRETRHDEHRVGLTPFGAGRLVELGHDVLVESGAGRDSHFSDEDYAARGARIVHTADEVYLGTDLVCQVGPLSAEEIDRLRPEGTICGFLHLALAGPELVEAVEAREVSLVGYELLQTDDGRRPLLEALSELGGQLAVHTAAQLLTRTAGGRGLLLGGVPGIPPATVVVLGAGTAGRATARLALAAGAHVIVMDERLDALRRTMQEVSRDVVTAVPSARNIERFCAIADVLVGAVAVPGGRSPYVVPEPIVRRMKPGSVIIDLAIDQGGCVETSRPTTLREPTYELHGVIHHCVPNLTANVPRTASRALTIAALPWISTLAERGLEGALGEHAALRRSLYTYRGKLVNRRAAEALGRPWQPIDRLL
ncbi:MAG: alanine dehydrogenase [Acidobacteria bacterium]|nr:MAG: alanine dehydrogenase [Acidobacteriota bacterium]